MVKFPIKKHVTVVKHFILNQSVIYTYAKKTGEFQHDKP